MDLAEREAEISGDFRQLPPNRQDCVLETVRALSWAARSFKSQKAASIAGDELGPNSPIAGESVIYSR
jgi:hypothetical protein